MPMDGVGEVVVSLVDIISFDASTDKLTSDSVNSCGQQLPLALKYRGFDVSRSVRGVGEVSDGSGGGWEAMVHSFRRSIELKDRIQHVVRAGCTYLEGPRQL